MKQNTSHPLQTKVPRALFAGENSLLQKSPTARMAVLMPLIVSCSFLGAGCAAPSLTGNNPEYHTTRTPQQIAADNANIDRVENTARRQQHEDDMANAQATEVATRHNPTHVSTSTTTVVPFFW
jgi:hypothetical protein